MIKEALCELCGEPMPEGEEMFKFHGYSGNCPKPPLPSKSDGAETLDTIAAQAATIAAQAAQIEALTSLATEMANAIERQLSYTGKGIQPSERLQAAIQRVRAIAAVGDKHD